MKKNNCIVVEECGSESDKDLDLVKQELALIWAQFMVESIRTLIQNGLLVVQDRKVVPPSDKKG
ncbi:MAG TPA: hypothetical protein PKW33_21130 [Anaerolineaceae bacterium]|nr:hypothetical protein [Anaerolineaceae bacterium]HPN54114.1 hypothetical protein [Anaerolineaceae bacterium]